MTFDELQISIISKVQDQMENGSVAEAFIAEVTLEYFNNLILNYPDFKINHCLHFNIDFNSDVSTAYAFYKGKKLMSSAVQI